MNAVKEVKKYIKTNIDIRTDVKIYLESTHEKKIKSYNYHSDVDRVLISAVGMLSNYDIVEAVEDVLFTVDMIDCYDKIVIEHSKGVITLKKSHEISVDVKEL